jgi:hypothetical protein
MVQKIPMGFMGDTYLLFTQRAHPPLLNDEGLPMD